MNRFVNAIICILLVLVLAGCGTEDEDIGNVSNADTDVVASEVAEVEDSEKVESLETEKIEEEDDRRLKFSTVDIDGNPMTEEIIKDAKVVLINFWEPWCGPCVGEMPELEELYENYKDKGLLILGVFSTEGMDDDVKEILEYCGTTYPVIRCDMNLVQYMTDYVPTTIFADSEGNILSTEPIIGANSYSDWEQILSEYLE